MYRQRWERGWVWGVEDSVIGCDETEPSRNWGSIENCHRRILLVAVRGYEIP
jgi:hypothetical protein